MKKCKYFKWKNEEEEKKSRRLKSVETNKKKEDTVGTVRVFKFVQAS